MRKLVKKRIEGKIYKGHMYNKAITLISFAISRKCVRYEERA